MIEIKRFFCCGGSYSLWRRKTQTYLTTVALRSHFLWTSACSAAFASKWRRVWRWWPKRLPVRQTMITEAGNGSRFGN